MAEPITDRSARPPVVTPGALLRAARLEQGLSPPEVASALNWLPVYVAIIEEDRHQDLPRPSFGRGYVKAYARLLGIGQPRILRALDEWEEELQASGRAPGGGGGAKPARRPPQLHRSGVSVTTGLAVLVLLAATLWVWHGDGRGAPQPAGATLQPSGASIGGGAE